MKLKQVTGIFFSPTDSTRQVVEGIAEGLNQKPDFLDLTKGGRQKINYSFTESEAVVVGMPVYGGRIPGLAAERLLKLHGRSTPAILVVVYGNRAYEDALLELGDLLEGQGFVIAGALAVVAEHNMVSGIATSRPDQKDQKKLEKFVHQIQGKLYDMPSSYRQKKPLIPGHRPYKIHKKMMVPIKVSGDCNHCGLCIQECPVQAISRTDPKVVDQERCLLCMRCIKQCPLQARKLPFAWKFAAGRMLKKSCQGRKEPELFL